MEYVYKEYIYKTMGEFLANEIASGKFKTHKECGEHYELSKARFSGYFHGVHTPKLALAQQVFDETGVIIHPYSLEAVSDGVYRHNVYSVLSVDNNEGENDEQD